MENYTESVRNATIESLLLMAVLAQGLPKESALHELRRRKMLRREAEFEDIYMTNFSVVAY